MGLSNVAFMTPNGKTVLIVINENDKPMTFNVRYKKKQITPIIEGKSVITFVW